MWTTLRWRFNVPFLSRNGVSIHAPREHRARFIAKEPDPGANSRHRLVARGSIVDPNKYFTLHSHKCLRRIALSGFQSTFGGLVYAAFSPPNPHPAINQFPKKKPWGARAPGQSRRTQPSPFARTSANKIFINSCALHERQNRILIAKNRLARSVQPVLQNARIHRPEIHDVFQIALVQIVERWMPAHDPLLNP